MDIDMPPTPDERAEFGQLLKERRGDRTLQQVSDYLRASGLLASVAQLSAWERGEYAPKDRKTVIVLDKMMKADGELVAALGYEGTEDRVHPLRLRDWTVASLGRHDAALLELAERVSALEQHLGLDSGLLAAAEGDPPERAEVVTAARKRGGRPKPKAPRE